MRVPEYQRQIQDASLPQVQQISAVKGSNDFINPGIEAAAQAGANLFKGVEQGAMSAYEKEINDANRSRTLAATTELNTYDQDAAFSKDGWLNQKGAAVFSQQNSKPLTDNVLDARAEKIAHIADGLGNEDQRRMFMEYATNSDVRLRESLLQHENEQYRVFKRSTLTDAIQGQSQNMALYNNDIDGLKQSIANMRSYAEDLGNLEGYGKGHSKSQYANSLISNSLKLAVSNAMAQGRSGDAFKILHQLGPEFEPNDHLEMFSKWNKSQEGLQAIDAATNAVMPMASVPGNYPLGKINEITRMTESGNQHFVNPGYGKRKDGSFKGMGYFGPLQRPDGSVSTELSIGVNIDGKEMEIPTLVPNLSSAEKDHLLSLKEGDSIPEPIIKKAVDHAKMRFEEGKSPFRELEPVVSDAGAVGISQLMPDTAPLAAKAAGVDWNEYRFKYDSQYNQMLGEAWIGKMLNEFAGDPAKAWAAYNAGEGKKSDSDGYDAQGSPLPGVYPAIARASARGAPNDWLSELPSETRKYVNNNMAKLSAITNVEQPISIEEARVNALASLKQTNQNPSAELVERTLSHAEHLAEVHNRDINERRQFAKSQVINSLIANRGDWTSVPPDQMAALNPEDKPALMRTAKELATNGRIGTDLSLYGKLASNPAYLKSLSENEFNAMQEKLSLEDWKAFARERGHSDPNSKDPSDIDSTTLNLFIKNRLEQMSLLPKNSDVEGNAMAAARIKVARDALMIAQTSAGHKFNDQELNKFVDELFVKNQTFRVTFWSKFDFLPFVDSNNQIQIMKSSYAEIPGEALEMIKSDLKAMGNNNPTKSEILEQFIRNGIGKHG